MSYPHLILREAIVFQVLTIVLVAVALFWDAPLEQLANPLLTPNPAKAPWYFLGLQELLHYFPPIVAGVLIPTLVVLGLVVIPYFEINIQGEPLWSGNRRRRARILVGVLIALFVVSWPFTTLGPCWFPRCWWQLWPCFLISSRPAPSRFMQFLRSRTLPWWVMTWFIAVALTLTIVGLFSGARDGPGSGLGDDMLPEEMGKVSRRFRWAFAVSSVVFLAVLAVSPVRDYLRVVEAIRKGLRPLRPDPAGHQALAGGFPVRDRPDLDPANGRCGSLHHLPSGHYPAKLAGFLRAATLPGPSTHSASGTRLGMRYLPSWPRLGDGSSRRARDHARLGAADPARPVHPGFLRRLPPLRPEGRPRASIAAARFWSGSTAWAAIACRESSARRCSART